jgi:hypothetical protein
MEPSDKADTSTRTVGSPSILNPGLVARSLEATAMAGNRPPGPLNPQDKYCLVDRGTRCLAETPTPGVTGFRASDVILEDQDAHQSRRISTASLEFRSNFIDYNIVDVDFWSTAFASEDRKYRDFWVNYRDGRRLHFNLDDIPVRVALPKSGRWARSALRPRKYCKRCGFIYPDIYGEGSTPTLIDIATTIAFNQHQREKFLEVATLSFQFAVILSAYVGPPEIKEIPRARRPGMRLPRPAPEKPVFVEIGAGDLKASIGYARQGATVIAVDPAAPSATALKELEAAGGTFIKGTAKEVSAGVADHVYQYFPWRIEGTGSHVSGGTWRLVDDTMRLLKPNGAAHFVTESERTAKFLVKEASRKGLRTVLTKSTAGAAAPGASGSGVPGFSSRSNVWVVNIYKR